MADALTTLPQNHRRSRRDKGTQERLLTSARIIFAESGWGDTTIDKIVKHARVARGSFYVYFQNKQDVFDRIVGPVLDDLYERGEARREGETIFERLEAGNRALLEVWLTHPDVMRMLVDYSAVNGSVYQARRNRFIGRSAEALRRHKEAGITYDIDPYFAASALAGMVESFAHNQLSMATDLVRDRDLIDISYGLTALWYRSVYTSLAPAVPDRTDYRKSLVVKSDSDGPAPASPSPSRVLARPPAPPASPARRRP